MRFRPGWLCAGLLIWAAPVLAKEPKPVRCPARGEYAGKPLHTGVIELPPPGLALGSAYPEGLQRELAGAVDEAKKLTGAPVLGAAVADERGFFASDGDPVLYWASVGKAFTATAALQLVEEGKLRLDDRLARWFPAFPHADLLTIDDLLLHTGGIFSANEAPEVRAEPRYRPPLESVALAARHGALFCPGADWRYSNTGYTLLGLVLEAVEGQSYREIIQKRILDRLGGTRLRVVSADDPRTDWAPLVPKDGTEPILHPAWAGAAGSVVGPASDMLRFWHALLTGRLLSPAATAGRFERLFPMFDSGTFYGRGVMVYDVPGVFWLGHSGGTPGAKALVAYSPSDHAFVAVALNTDGPAEAVANLLLARLRVARNP